LNKEKQIDKRNPIKFLLLFVPVGYLLLKSISSFSLFRIEINMTESLDTMFEISAEISAEFSMELSVGDSFDNWAVAENTIKEFGKRNGFVINRHRVQYSKNLMSNSNEKVVKKRTFVCENFGKYKPNKVSQIEQQHNKGSKKTDCKWHINLSKPENADFIHITFIHGDHNHELLADNTRFATTFRKFDASIMKEIEHAVIYGHCDAHTIRNLLQPLFPDQLFLTQDLSNAIQKIKHEHQIQGTDASHLLKFLLKKQQEDPTMFVQPLINVDSDRLCGIFWMTSNQILLWSRYSDVILHDNTSRTNKYKFPLSLFILVDNNGKSRLGAQAFLNDETQESYEWVLQQTLDATGSKPQVILTDMDPAMNAACQNIYKDTYHIHCIWHMSQNLPKRLKHKLGSADFKTFNKDFWKTRNSLCIEVFEQRFQALLKKFPNSSNYMHSTLYPIRHSWAQAFTSRIFTAGMQSTQRVESINAIVHKAISSSSTIAEVVEFLDSRMQKEELNKSFMAWKYKTTTYHQPFVVDNFFSDINILIKKYLTPHIVEEIHKQMCESVLYKCEKISLEVVFNQMVILF
jgi:hypothetical protein